MPAPAQVPDEQVGEQERAEVADVGRSVDGRAGTSRRRRSRRGPRTRASPPTACRADGASSDRLDGRDRQRRDGPPRALGAVEVAGRGLDVDRDVHSMSSRPAMASRIGSRWAARRGRAPRIVRSTVPHASRRPVPDVVPPRRVSRSRSRRRPRVRREEAPEVAESGRAEKRLAHRVEHDVAVGMPDEPRRALDRDATEPERPAGSNGWLSWPMPVRIRAMLPSSSDAARRGRPGASP